eukprot:731067-Lingulodinium_polyedra.AAC.1
MASQDEVDAMLAAEALMDDVGARDAKLHSRRMARRALRATMLAVAANAADGCHHDLPKQR